MQHLRQVFKRVHRFKTIDKHVIAMTDTQYAANKQMCRARLIQDLVEKNLLSSEQVVEME
jgi:hypothetical protein